MARWRSCSGRWRRITSWHGRCTRCEVLHFENSPLSIDKRRIYNLDGDFVPAAMQMEHSKIVQDLQMRLVRIFVLLCPFRPDLLFFVTAAGRSTKLGISAGKGEVSLFSDLGSL